MILLAFETSCDDTAVSVIEAKGKRLKLRSHVQYSQIKTHAKYGGVIPEVAAREHAVTIVPTLKAAMQKAHITYDKLDVIAATQGPGLAPALSVGIGAARILSRLYNKPLMGINHIEGHIASVWPINGILESAHSAPKLPALALIVSGGHTELQLIKKFGDYKLLGRTRDDAAGEAFDKVAALLGLPYPGGPSVSMQAVRGKRNAYHFPRPMLADTSLDFSFSGLKTAVRYSLDKKKLTRNDVQDICASFEQAVVDVLVEKTLRAVRHYRPKSVFLVGGVSANRHLRDTLRKKLSSLHEGLFLAPQKLTVDNATMIAMAAAFSKKKGSRSAWKTMEAEPSWELG